MSTTVLTAQAARRLAIPGTVFNITVSAAESNNSIVVADFEAIPGSEPPRHIHTVEDEVFILKEGSVTFFIGDEIIHAKDGDTVFLPVNVPHHFVITSEKVTATVIATPGDIEEFFRSLAWEYNEEGIPPVLPPTEEQLAYFVKQAEKFGMQFC